MPGSDTGGVANKSFHVARGGLILVMTLLPLVVLPVKPTWRICAPATVAPWESVSEVGVVWAAGSVVAMVVPAGRGAGLVVPPSASTARICMSAVTSAVLPGLFVRAVTVLLGGGVPVLVLDSVPMTPLGKARMLPLASRKSPLQASCVMCVQENAPVQRALML